MRRRIALLGTIVALIAGAAIATGVAGAGASLADAGPRLVVPGDKRGGRYVSNVVRVRLERGR